MREHLNKSSCTKSVDNASTYCSEGITCSIGVNICKQKSGTERTKKRKKRELVRFTPPGGATGTVVHRLDAKRILPELR